MSRIVQEQLPRGARNQSWSDEAKSVFRDSPYYELRQVICRVEGGRCVQSGTVRSFYLKQLAQCLLLNQAERTLPLDNQLRVHLESGADF